MGGEWIRVDVGYWFGCLLEGIFYIEFNLVYLIGFVRLKRILILWVLFIISVVILIK